MTTAPSAPVQYADLPKRAAGRCGSCVHYVIGGITGRYATRPCEALGQAVRKEWRACERYQFRRRNKGAIPRAVRASGSATHDALPKANAYTCQECEHRTATDQGRASSRLFTCAIHGHVVQTRYAACVQLVLTEFRIRQRTGKTEGEIKQPRRRATPEKTGAVVAPITASITRCPRCQGELRRDGGSLFCVGCWSTAWDSATVSDRRPLAEALVTWSGSRRWGT